MRRALRLLLPLLLLAASSPARGAEPAWDGVLARARGQTVYFNAWGGSQQVNDYLSWVTGRVRDEHGVELRHVKLTDTAEAVGRVRAEAAAGRTAGGSVDLVWINGENFAAMLRQGLLHGPFAEALPNFRFVDVEGKPTTVLDFTIPVRGMESPWGMAQLVFLHDAAALPDPPRSATALLAWAEAHPGRFTYPQPPSFLGSTFLKQVLRELVDDPAILLRPADGDGPGAAAFEGAAARLWAYLDRLHPALWRGGRAFPSGGPEARRLLEDGELDLSLSFDPLEAAAAAAAGLLPPTARAVGFEGGTIGNTHFVAIPFNANAKEGAMAIADFLLSPEAQARKQDPRHWGSLTVLDLAALPPEGRAWFDRIPANPAVPGPDALGPTLPEPHASWMERLEAEWERRYARG